MKKELVKKLDTIRDAAYDIISGSQAASLHILDHRHGNDLSTGEKLAKVFGAAALKKAIQRSDFADKQYNVVTMILDASNAGKDGDRTYVFALKGTNLKKVFPSLANRARKEIQNFLEERGLTFKNGTAVSYKRP